MLEKIYLISIGEYSDYRVLGVYATKELAEEVIKDIDISDYRHNSIRIEESYLNLTPKLGKQVAIFMDINTGGVLRIDDFNLLTSFGIHPKGYLTSLYFPRITVMYYYSDTLERATKAGNEKRVQFLASGLSVEDWNDTL